MKNSSKFFLALLLVPFLVGAFWSMHEYGAKGLFIAIILFFIWGVIVALAKEWNDPDSPLNIPYSEERDRRQWP